MDQQGPITLDSIKEALHSGELVSASQQLEAYLQINHNDVAAIRLYDKVRNKIYHANIKKVKQGIKQSKKLWKQGRYKELLNLYLKLQQYAPNYAHLQSLINKAYKMQHKLEVENTGTMMKKVNDTLNQYIKAGDFRQALAFLQEVIAKDMGNPVLQKILVDTKRKIIDEKLNRNKANFKKASLPDAYDFIKSLYELEPTYHKTQQLLIQYHKLLKKYYGDKKHVFTKDAKRQIKILYNTKEYYKALQAIAELLKVDSKNKFANKYRKKTETQIDAQNFREAYAIINKKVESPT